MNVIGSDVKAEIFRQHRHSIMLLGFVGNCRDMVTMDTGGYINRWKYARYALALKTLSVSLLMFKFSWNLPGNNTIFKNAMYGIVVLPALKRTKR